jgi:hypothetical protein
VEAANWLNSSKCMIFEVSEPADPKENDLRREESSLHHFICFLKKEEVW